MGEAGDFVAGLSTPVVFLWLIYGYFLQRRELSLQRKELQQTRETLNEQVRIQGERADAERRLSMPSLRLEKDRRSTQEQAFLFLNLGGAAHGLELDLNGLVEGLNQLTARNRPQRRNPQSSSTVQAHCSAIQGVTRGTYLTIPSRRRPSTRPSVPMAISLRTMLSPPPAAPST